MRKAFVDELYGTTFLILDDFRFMNIKNTSISQEFIFAIIVNVHFSPTFFLQVMHLIL